MFFVGLQGQFSDVFEWNFLEPIVLGFQSNSLKDAFWTLQKRLVNLLRRYFREVGQILEGWAFTCSKWFCSGRTVVAIYIYTPGSSKSAKKVQFHPKSAKKTQKCYIFGRSPGIHNLRKSVCFLWVTFVPMIPSRLALVSKDSALGIDGLVQMNYFLLGCKQPIFTMNVSFGEGTVPQPASFKWLEWPFVLFKVTFSEIKRSLGRSWKICKRIRSEPMDRNSD